jgi:hypothetical protein
MSPKGIILRIQSKVGDTPVTLDRAALTVKKPASLSTTTSRCG